MKKISFLLFLALSLMSLVLFARYNGNYKIIISKLYESKNIKTKDLKYRVYLFGVIPAGEAFFAQPQEENFNKERVYHLKANAGGLGLSATLDSYVDIKQLTPFIFRQRLVSPGNERTDKEILYDQKRQIMSINGLKYKMQPNTQDPLSLLLNLRRMNFEKMSEFQINVNAHRKGYVFEGTAEPRDVSLHGNTYKIYILNGQVRRQDKNPRHRTKITVVLLKQEENIPLLIKVYAGGVFINVKLVDIR